MELEQIQIRATLGFSDAQLALGYMYYDGLGVPLDRERAMRLFKRAAGQGDAQAAWTLARAEQAAQLEAAPVARVALRAHAQKEPRADAGPRARKSTAHAVPMEWAPTASTAQKASRTPAHSRHSRRRRILPSERHAIALRFEHRCACCRVLLPVGWHLDHRVALADGGADDATNMQPLCPHCHTLKTAHENSGRVLLFKKEY
jgi:5-methylcytosine-specific restriction endonuclease McrA